MFVSDNGYHPQFNNKVEVVETKYLMKLLKFIFITISRKIVRVISEKCEYFYYRFYYSKPELEMDFIHKRYLVCGGDDLREVPKCYCEIFHDGIQNIVIQADLICEHIFDLLGSGAKKLSTEGEGYQSIDWHIDFKSNYSWNPKIFFRSIRYGHIEGVDIKVPWELSRFQHLNILGQAYILTKDVKYAEEFKNQITDWIENNPVAFGVNWKCTMDIAIRAANWLVAQEYFSSKNVFPKDFWKDFYASIYEHGMFIMKHLENQSEFTTNHYISNLAGLFFIAVYCPFFEESKSWQEFALKELSKEIEKQVYPDGCTFENSTSYHRLVLELFFYTELLGDRAEIEFSEHYKEKVSKMFEFSLHCIKSDGRVPQIGDNDNGRFLIFSKRLILEHKYLLSLAAIYYKNSDFKVPTFTYDEEAFWFFGKTSIEVFKTLPFRKKSIASKRFSDAGCYLLRHNDDYCFISCAPNGQKGIGGHSHNDKLSFELMLNGRDIIVDPGTYVYTPYPNKRNKFRSTEYHNIIKFNGFEQNKITDELFVLFDRVRIIDAAITETNGEVAFQGNIKYINITHKRMIIFNKRTSFWQIIDYVSCSNEINARVYFHLSPNLTSESNSIFIKGTRNEIASIEVAGYNLKKCDYDYSPEYGVKIKSECLFVDILATKGIITVHTFISKK